MPLPIVVQTKSRISSVSVSNLLTLCRQFAGYLLSGVTAAALAIGVFAVLVHFGVWYVAASVLTDVLGFLVVFVLNKYIVFGKKDRVVSHAIRYTLVQVGNTVLQAAIIYLLVEYTAMDKVLARTISIGCCVPVNFVLYKYVVYV